MKLSLFGYGGHSREVATYIGDDVTFFVDDKYTNKFTKPISEFNPQEYVMMVAVSDPKDRLSIVQRLPKTTQYFTFIHPTSHVVNSINEIGYGSFIGPYSILTTNIKIGNHSILNRMCQIGHDTITGDYLSMMPGSIISGNVTVGDNVYIGTNSSIREKINICSNVTIGLNSGVVKNILHPGVYVGSPAKKIK